MVNGPDDVFVDRDGRLTEGATSNLFVSKRGRLLTPPIAGILPGLTRRLIIQVAHADGIHVSERPPT